MLNYDQRTGAGTTGRLYPATIPAPHRRPKQVGSQPEKVFSPVQILSALFCGKFLAALKRLKRTEATSNQAKNSETGEQISPRAALAYSKHQKCSLKAAKNLLVTGW